MAISLSVVLLLAVILVVMIRGKSIKVGPAIVASLVVGGWPAFARFGAGFLVGTEWDPVRETFGALPAIYGTLVTSIIALLIAVPLSFGIAVFLTELCPAGLRRPLGVVGEEEVVHGVLDPRLAAGQVRGHERVDAGRVCAGARAPGRLVEHLNDRER